MAGTKKILMVVLEDKDEFALQDLVRNVSYFCPDATLALYNSGNNKSLGKYLNLLHVPKPKQLKYARVTPFFFDVFEWINTSAIDCDYFINLETDMLFIRKGFEFFLQHAMGTSDYMAPLFRRFTSRKSRWRPIRSLRAELPDWYEALGVNYTHQGFSPGQVFSRAYIQKLLTHPVYPEIKRLWEKNRSFTLQEVLFPTLVDVLQMKGRSYPAGLEPIIRYRPYQGISGVKRALEIHNAYFVHPVRREPYCASRILIRSLLDAD